MGITCPNNGVNLIPTTNGVIKHADFKYDIFSGLLEARSAEHERTKVAKRPL